MSNTATIKKWNRAELDHAFNVLLEYKKNIRTYHVISRGDRWGVLREGSKRFNKIHSDKRSAVAHAKQLAQKNPKWEVVIHNKDANPEKCFFSYKKKD